MHVFARLAGLVLIANLQFALVSMLQALQYVATVTVLVLHQTLAHATLTTLVTNAKFQFAMVLLLTRPILAQATVTVQEATLVSATTSLLAHNVTFQSALVQMQTLLQHVTMATVPASTITLAHASLATLVLSANNQFALA